MWRGFVTRHAGMLPAFFEFPEKFPGLNALFSMAFYTRRLPHWHPDNAPLFITWTLHGVLPHNRYPPSDSPAAGKAFVWMDRFLDQARSGPRWLERAEIARMVVDSLYFAAERLRQFDLHAYVVMPNHVHVLVTQQTAPATLVQSVKRFTAREANRILGRTGETFWQNEYYDHWARNEKQFERIARYIEENPVAAGMVGRAEDYRWSSAFRGVGNAGMDSGMAG